MRQLAQHSYIHSPLVCMTFCQNNKDDRTGEKQTKETSSLIHMTDIKSIINACSLLLI